MDRKYFFEMGAYDPGLKIWGGENFELSFKVNQTPIHTFVILLVLKNLVNKGFFSDVLKIQFVSLTINVA